MKKLLVIFAAISMTALLKKYATRYSDIIEAENTSKETRVDEAQQMEAIRLKTQAEEIWSRIKVINRDNGFGNMLDSVATLIQSGQSSIEMKAYSAAISFYTELLEKCKTIETLENQRKAAFESKQKFEEEISLVERVIVFLSDKGVLEKVNPHDENVYYKFRPEKINIIQKKLISDLDI